MFNLGYEKTTRKDADGFAEGFIVSDKVIINNIVFLQTTRFSRFSNGEMHFYNTHFTVDFNGLICFPSSIEDLHFLLKNKEKKNEFPVQINFVEWFH